MQLHQLRISWIDIDVALVSKLRPLLWFQIGQTADAIELQLEQVIF